MAKTIYDHSGIQCTSLNVIFNASTLDNIVSTLRTKIILILLEIEKKFESIDDLDIDTDSISKPENEKLRKNIYAIAYDDTVM